MNFMSLGAYTCREKKRLNSAMTRHLIPANYGLVFAK